MEPGTSLLLATVHLGCLGLEAIAATPRHPLVQSALEGACRSVLQWEGFSRWELSGAGLLSGCFSRWMGPHLRSMEQGAAGLPAVVRVLSLG